MVLEGNYVNLSKIKNSRDTFCDFISFSRAREKKVSCPIFFQFFKIKNIVHTIKKV